MKRFGKRERGFTLIELLVVVGIMAALAAIVVPNVARFVGTGKSEGAAAEHDAVQAGIDAAIADLGLTTVTQDTGVGVGTKTFDLWDLDPNTAGVQALYPQYLRIDTAKYGTGGAAGAGYDISNTGEVAK